MSEHQHCADEIARIEADCQRELADLRARLESSERMRERMREALRIVIEDSRSRSFIVHGIDGSRSGYILRPEIFDQAAAALSGCEPTEHAALVQAVLDAAQDMVLMKPNCYPNLRDAVCNYYGRKPDALPDAIKRELEGE